MHTDVLFRHIDRTESLNNYLHEKAEAIAEDFFKHDPDAHVTVRVEIVRGRIAARKPSFRCEVILKPTKSRETIKVVKASDNFFEAAQKSIQALKRTLSRRSERLAYDRKHEDRRNTA